MSEDFEAKKRALKTALDCNVIDRTAYSKSLRGLELAEENMLTRNLRAAQEALRNFRDGKDRERARKDLLSKLKRSLRRYEELPE